MGDAVELKVTGDFRQLLSSLEGMKTKSREVNETIARISIELSDNIRKNTKRTERQLEETRDLGRRVADQLRGYFKDLFKSVAASLEVAKKDLGLKQQFKDATMGAVELYDTVKKLSATLGIAEKNAVSFQRALTKSFSAAGLSQQDASNALEGVARTQVRGEGNIIEYATMAANLATQSNERGNEGRVAQLIADTLRDRGQNQNNMAAARALVEDVSRVTVATGKPASETLGEFSGLYQAMAGSRRRQVSPDTLRDLASIESVVGPDLKALVSDLTEGKLKSLPREMQGVGQLLTDKGFNFDRLRKISGIGNRISFDNEESWRTAGLTSDGSARAMVRLLEQLDTARAAQASVQGMRGSVAQRAADSRGVVENAGAVKNNVVNTLGKIMSPAVDAVNSILKWGAQGPGNSALLMAGGFGAAALGSKAFGALTKGFGGAGSIASGLAKGALIGQITGEATVPVYVVNADEIGGGGFEKLTTKALDAAAGGAAMKGAAGVAGIGAGVLTTALAAGAAALTIGSGAGVVTEMLNNPEMKVEDAKDMQFQQMMSMLKEIASGDKGPLEAVSSKIDDMTKAILTTEQRARERDNRKALQSPSSNRDSSRGSSNAPGGR